MRKLFSCFILSALVGCGIDTQEEYRPIQEPPSDAESKAQSDFYGSELVRGYYSNGVKLSCEKICSKLTETQFAQLKQVGPKFFSLKQKLESVRLIEANEIAFSHPVGTYSINIPWNASSQDFETLFSVMSKVSELEVVLGAKVFVSGATQKFSDALTVLLDKSILLKQLNLPKLYLTAEPTEFSRMLRIAQINTAGILKDFSVEIERLKLFVKAYSKFRSVDFGVRSGEPDEYLFLNTIIDNADRLNGAIGNYSYNLLIGKSKPGFYFSGRNLLGYSIIGVGSDWSIAELAHVLEYETALLDLVNLLRRRIDHVEAQVSYSGFKICHTKLAALSDPIQKKVASIKSIEIDYLTDSSSSFESNKILRLNCVKDSAEDLVRLITEIP